MLVYIHVPFCRTKCRYCAFYSVPVGSCGAADDAVRLYARTLLAEITLWGDRLGTVPVESIFFGGGTPSLLPPAVLGQVLEKLHTTFAVSPQAEISLEANPESFLAVGYAHEAKALGINRVSLGVQSLNDDSLTALGRPHGRREALAAYDLARAAGFAAIGLDLLWGLPGQRCQNWMRELAEIVTLQPDHLSCYGLTPEEGTPFFQALEDGRIVLPNDKELTAMYMDGGDFLETGGYLQYEISNFARKGFQCRHNVGYWESSDYLGLGPAATSTIRGLRWTHPHDIRQWAADIAGGTPDNNVETLSPETRLLEMVMLRLRTSRGLSLKAYRELTGHSFVRENKELVQHLRRQNLVQFCNGAIRLTRNGMLVSDSILACLFDAIDHRLEDAQGAQTVSGKRRSDKMTPP